MAKNVAGETLRQNYELQKKFSEFYRQINQDDGYPFDFEKLMEHLQKGVEGQFFQKGKSIHKDYKPIKSGIVIEIKERNRQEILNDTEKYVLGDNFKNNILAKCTNGKTGREILREDELLKYKKDKEIMKEMNIVEISADQIAERIIQLGKVKCWTIVGYCNGLAVDVHPNGVGRVAVNANELGAWDAGIHLVSSDIEI